MSNGPFSSIASFIFGGSAGPPPASTTNTNTSAQAGRGVSSCSSVSCSGGAQSAFATNSSLAAPADGVDQVVVSAARMPQVGDYATGKGTDFFVVTDYIPPTATDIATLVVSAYLQGKYRQTMLGGTGLGLLAYVPGNDLANCVYAGGCNAGHLGLAVIGVLPEGTAVKEVEGAAQGFRSFRAFKNAMGRAGPEMNWHHIVGQTPGNIARFGPEAIHNTQNLIRMDARIRGLVSKYYSGKDFFTGGQTVRQWLSDQSFEEQMQFGLDTLRRFGVER